MGLLVLERATPATPSSGYSILYPKTDGQWYFKDDAGVEHPVSAGIQETVLNAKGDLISASAADTPAVLTVGANGLFLKADSAQATGLVWSAIQAASDTVAGILEIATQAEQETGTDVVRAVTPGRQRFHPSAAKAWVNFNGTGTVAIRSDYGVSSITDNAVGDYTVNFDTAMADTNYCVVAWSGDTTRPGGTQYWWQVNANATGNVRIFTNNSVLGAGTTAAADHPVVSVAIFGDQ